MLETLGVETRESRLVALNNDIVNAERCATKDDVAYLATVLSDNLLFRRADETIVDKGKFLDDVPASAKRLKRRHSINLQTHVLGPSALVTLTVVGVVDTDGRDEVRAFKNIRFFVERNGRWLLEYWYNERTTPPEPVDSGGIADSAN